MSTTEIIPEVVSPPPRGMEGAHIVLQHEVAPLLCVLTSRHREELAIRIRDLEATAADLVQRMGSITITDEASYHAVAGQIEEAAAYLKDSGSVADPFCEITDAFHKQATGLRKRLQGQVEAQLKVKKNDVLAWAAAQEAIRKANEARLADEQRKVEEASKLFQAELAEEAGMSEEAIDTILNMPSTAPAPIAAPTFEKASGLTTGKNWCAEVDNFHALVKHVAKHKDLLPLLYAYDPEKRTSSNLNAQAKALKEAMQLPGVRAVNKGRVSVRGGAQ